MTRSFDTTTNFTTVASPAALLPRCELGDPNRYLRVRPWLRSRRIAGARGLTWIYSAEAASVEQQTQQVDSPIA